MSDRTKRDDKEPVRRSGGESRLQRGLQEDDRRDDGRVIRDDSYSKDRNERRRGRFIDIHEDEDHDPDTSEADRFESPQGTQNDGARRPSRLARMRRNLLDRVRNSGGN